MSNQTFRRLFFDDSNCSGDTTERGVSAPATTIFLGRCLVSCAIKRRRKNLFVSVWSSNFFANIRFSAMRASKALPALGKNLITYFSFLLNLSVPGGNVIKLLHCSKHVVNFGAEFKKRFWRLTMGRPIAKFNRHWMNLLLFRK